jgi:hypothetical protein
MKLMGIFYLKPFGDTLFASKILTITASIVSCLCDFLNENNVLKLSLLATTLFSDSTHHQTFGCLQLKSLFK